MKRLLLSIIPVFVLGMVLNGLFHGVAAAPFFDQQLAPLGGTVNKMADFIPLEFVAMMIYGVLGGAVVGWINRK